MESAPISSLFGNIGAKSEPMNGALKAHVNSPLTDNLATNRWIRFMFHVAPKILFFCRVKNKFLGLTGLHEKIQQS